MSHDSPGASNTDFMGSIGSVDVGRGVGAGAESFDLDGMAGMAFDHFRQ